MFGARTTFFLDVDNTLIDNDAAKVELQRRLDDLLGPDEAARFWATYEAVRAETGIVNIPLALQRFERAGPAGGAARPLAARSALASVFTLFPYPRYLFAETLAVIAGLRIWADVAIFSDGDSVFQVRKIWRAGLADAVAGAVMVFPRKTEHFLEATAFYPADRHVIVDDKPAVLRRARAVLGDAATTVQIAHGHYAARDAADGDPAIDLRLRAIGELATHFDPDSSR